MKSPMDSVVLVTPRSFGAHDPSVRAELEAAVGEVRYNQTGRSYRAEELRARIADVDGLLAGLDEIDASVFRAASRLRVVARYGVGTNNVDLRAAAEHGVVVTNTPGANAEAVAELVIGFLFALARSIVPADRAAHAGEWPSMVGIEVAGKTVGVLGLGKIGQAVARRAGALGCTVVAYDPYVEGQIADDCAARLAPLDVVLAQAHFLSLHLPLNPETGGLIDRSLLERVREGAYLINTARGELVVDEDLVWALDTGRLRGAALDTLDNEPPPADHPLLQRKDVLITPHMGAHTVEAAVTMGRDALHDLIAVLAGDTPRFPVRVESEVRHVHA